MNQTNNKTEVKRSWWYSTFRAIGHFCFRNWWLILLLFAISLITTSVYIYQLRKKEIICCIKFDKAQKELKKLEQLLANCSSCVLPIDQPRAEANPNQINFDADYIILTYKFTDGADLDTRTRMISPTLNESQQNGYLGWSRGSSWPNSGSPVLSWGGDNMGRGLESVLVNLLSFKQQFVSQNNFDIDMRGFWFGIAGDNPVNIHATLYKGGTPKLVGGSYKYIINDFTDSVSLNSASKVISKQIIKVATTEGERIATFNYNLDNKTGTFQQ